LLELSSSHFIIKLLHKELNEVTAQRMFVHSAMEVSGVCDDPVLSTTWSNVSSKHTCGKIKAVNSELLQARHPVPVSNRHSALSYLSECTIREEETVPSKREMVNQRRSNYYKKSSEERGVKNSIMKHRPDQRPPVSNEHLL
jgi:hypothetical protein